VDPVQVLGQLGGVASWRALEQRGITRHHLDVAVECGTVRRIARGRYALSTSSDELIAAARVGGLLAGETAAKHLGLAVLRPPARPCIAVPRNRSRCEDQEIDVIRRDYPPGSHDGVATGLLDTALDCARRLELVDAVVIADAALYRGLDPGLLRATAAAARGKGSAAIRDVAQRADGRAESPIETCIRLALGGLAIEVRLQVVIRGVGRVDLLIDGWLVIEGDGFAFHQARADYRNDRRRANALTRRGFVLLRFSYEDAVHRPDYVRETVVAALARRRAA
jgi:very-short-patch-repair endonuclease